MHISPAVAGTDRSVSAAFVDSVLPDLLAHYRLQRATVLEQAGIDGAVFNDPGRLLPLLDVMRLFLVARRALRMANCRSCAVVIRPILTALSLLWRSIQSSAVALARAVRDK